MSIGKRHGRPLQNIFSTFDFALTLRIPRRLYTTKSEYAKNRLSARLAGSAGFEYSLRRPRLHGYAIMSAIKDWSGDVLRAEEGSLYPALHRMEEAGWIRAEWIMKDTGRRARIYELTAAGKKQLALEESRWQTVTSAVNRVLRTV